jgi:hypothetical protein
MKRLGWVVALVLAACSGDSPKSDGGQKCIGMLYDPCNTEHDCGNGNCRPFAAENIMVCTQACDTVSNPCPPQYMTIAVTCNATGLCEPAAANSCKIQ